MTPRELAVVLAAFAPRPTGFGRSDLDALIARFPDGGARRVDATTGE